MSWSEKPSMFNIRNRHRYSKIKTSICLRYQHPRPKGGEPKVSYRGYHLPESVSEQHHRLSGISRGSSRCDLPLHPSLDFGGVSGGAIPLRFTSVSPSRWELWVLDISMDTRHGPTFLTSVYWGWTLLVTYQTRVVLVSPSRRLPKPCPGFRESHWSSTGHLTF